MPSINSMDSNNIYLYHGKHEHESKPNCNNADLEHFKVMYLRLLFIILKIMPMHMMLTYTYFGKIIHVNFYKAFLPYGQISKDSKTTS